MLSFSRLVQLFPPLLLLMLADAALAQNFMVQCPNSTITHPASGSGFAEPAYNGATTYSSTGAFQTPTGNVNGTIKCQQISGGDGYMTEADGNQTFMFAFGPLSGLGQIANGQAGTTTPDVFDQAYCDPASPNYLNGQPNPYVNGTTDPLFSGVGSYTVQCNPNGAVGYVPPTVFRTASATTTLGAGNTATSATATYVSFVVITDSGTGYMTSSPPVSIAPPPCSPLGTGTCRTATAVATTSNGTVVEAAIVDGGAGYTAAPAVCFGPFVGGVCQPATFNNAIVRTDASAIMNTGVLNGNIPAPLMAIDEDDEFFLTLTNVGMIMRPDLFEQHTVHFHGYPNASSFYDGVPDASLAINIGASFTYYYLAPDAGTYFFHCHITPPEHLQMGMVGQLYVRPRQDRAKSGTALAQVAAEQQSDLRTACFSNGESNLAAGATGAPSADILCSVPPPAPVPTGTVAPTVTPHANAPCQDSGHTACYVYDDGDGSTQYDVDVPLQIHGFDPNFHFVGMTFNPEGFADMKDKYFLLNGRSYPDTIAPAGMTTQGSDGMSRPSQPIPALITLSASGSSGPQKAALRIADLDVTEYQTLASLGIPMHVVGYNAKLLRDQAGNDMDYFTNSITLGGGESLDVILDASLVPPGTYFLYTPNLDHLSNDAENFGGLMTEIVVTQ